MSSNEHKEFLEQKKAVYIAQIKALTHLNKAIKNITQFNEIESTVNGEELWYCIGFKMNVVNFQEGVVPRDYTKEDYTDDILGIRKKLGKVNQELFEIRCKEKECAENGERN